MKKEKQLQQLYDQLNDLSTSSDMSNLIELSGSINEEATKMKQYIQTNILEGKIRGTLATAITQQQEQLTTFTANLDSYAYTRYINSVGDQFVSYQNEFAHLISNGLVGNQIDSDVSQQLKEKHDRLLELVEHL